MNANLEDIGIGTSHWFEGHEHKMCVRDVSTKGSDIKSLH